VLAGLSTGGALGPLLFGTLVAAAGYRGAWAAAAVAMVVGAVAIHASHRAMPATAPATGSPSTTDE
jgi:dipeptide/tripeptide permease